MQSTLMRRAPLHVAIIMDGNGRWATRRGLPRSAGHRAGADAVRRVVEAAPDLGVTTLTLFAFSSDNWRRPVEEVSALMGLLQQYIRAELKRLVDSRALGGRQHSLARRLRATAGGAERARLSRRRPADPLGRREAPLGLPPMGMRLR